jgi:Family of unknown function (DUF6234)
MPDTSTSPAAGRRGDLLMVLEGMASVVAVVAICGLFVNWFGAHLALFGEPVVIHAEDVRNYWTILGVLVASVPLTFVLAGLRRAPRAWGWHLVVAGLGAVAAIAFAVTSTGTPTDEPEPSPPHRSGPLCYSGGDNTGCPGG